MSFLITPNGIAEENWKSVEEGTLSMPIADLPLPRVLERGFKRYGAYFKGWCQDFGEHESIEADDNGSDWLFAEDSVGLVLPKSLLKLLYRESLSRFQVPPLVFSQHGLKIGKLQFLFRKNSEKRVLAAIKELLEAESDLHVFLTSHLFYSSENRIITFSTKRPLSLIYREIGNMKIRLV